MREAARVAGLSPTAMYRYFPTADALRSALVPDWAPRAKAAQQQGFIDDFLTRAAGAAQVRDVVATLLGDRMDIGLIKLGPRASAFVAGRVVDVAAFDRGPGKLTVTVTVDLDVDIRLGKKYQRDVQARIALPLHVDVVPGKNLILQVQVHKPAKREIMVAVDVTGMAAVIRHVGRIDTITKRIAIKQVDAIVNSPAGKAATNIDLGNIIDQAWESGAAVNIAKLG